LLIFNFNRSLQWYLSVFIFLCYILDFYQMTPLRFNCFAELTLTQMFHPTSTTFYLAKFLQGRTLFVCIALIKSTTECWINSVQQCIFIKIPLSWMILRQSDRLLIEVLSVSVNLWASRGSEGSALSKA